MEWRGAGPLQLTDARLFRLNSFLFYIQAVKNCLGLRSVSIAGQEPISSIKEFRMAKKNLPGSN
jgi:hypothetical protein